MKVVVGFGAFFGLAVLFAMCNRSDSPASSRPAALQTTPPAAVVPRLSAEDSARFRQRAAEIVREQSPTGWVEADHARMNASADTVALFGDTTKQAVRRWIAAKRQADDERARTQAEEAQRQLDAGKWSYHSSTDPMASRSARSASIQSENTVDFDFPYGGPQHATLTLRNHPSYGRDVILNIREGQILCPSYDDCTIRVRFDEGPAERWTGVGPADNSTTVVFIRNYSRFMQRMRNAKVVRIEIPVYQEGQPTFEFRVGGFDSSRYASGS